MSEKVTQPIACPQCGKHTFFTHWKTINVSEHPELKAKARSGELFTLFCPHCQCPSIIDTSFVYHDEDAKILIHCADNQKGLQDALHLIENDVGANPKSYRVRVVTSLPDFQEKLAIFESGFDDRIIELAKMMFAAQVQAQGIKFDHIFFVQGAQGKEHAIQFFDSESGKSQGLWFNAQTKSVYSALEKQFAVLIKEHQQDALINTSWAVKLINEMSAKAR